LDGESYPAVVLHLTFLLLELELNGTQGSASIIRISLSYACEGIVQTSVGRREPAG